MFYRRHYQAIAKIIGDNITSIRTGLSKTEVIIPNLLIKDLCEYFKEDNDGFDADYFKKAIRAIVEEHANDRS